MEINVKQDRDKVLAEWRTRILNGFLIVVTLASIPAILITVLRSVGSPDYWSVVLPFLVVEIILLVLTIFRRLDYHIRVGGLLLVGYLAAIFSLRLGGLLGAAPLYLFVLPVVATIMIGRRAGIITTVLSILLACAFAFLFNRGILQQVEIAANTSGSLGTTLMLIIAGMTLLVLFYHFQERTIDKETSEQAELLKTQALLEEQKQTLEGTVQARTAELLKSSKIQTALYKIADAASSWQELGDFYREIHRVVGDLM